MSDYGYQTYSANKLLADCQKTGVEAAVLAASPGSGKTTISHIVISKYIKQHPNAKVLVLTHGQNLLKNQYIESLQNPHVEVSYTFGEFGQDVQVQIGLPQAIKKYPYNFVDLLIVDECHEFYLKKMVQNIVKKLKPKHQLLMTGSPSGAIRTFPGLISRCTTPASCAACRARAVCSTTRTTRNTSSRVVGVLGLDSGSRSMATGSPPACTSSNRTHAVVSETGALSRAVAIFFDSDSPST